MAIVFTCECGKKVQVADKMAGKKGKCPQCGTVLVIPLESEPVIEEPAPGVETSGAEPVETEPCPHCKEPIVVGAVFCTKCGTDLRTGQKHVATDATPGYDILKLWPDVFGKPTHAVGVVVDSPLNADNFMRALLLIGIGLVGFMLLWVVAASPSKEIILRPTETRWFYFPAFFLAGILMMVVDAVMASVAGRHFGSTGTSLAQTVMALLMTNAVFGLVSLVLAILIIYGKSIIPASDLVAGISPWLLLIWAAWLTMTVVYRAYDVSQALSAMFGVGASALKGFVIFGTMSLLEFVSKLTR